MSWPVKSSCAEVDPHGAGLVALRVVRGQLLERQRRELVRAAVVGVVDTLGGGRRQQADAQRDPERDEQPGPADPRPDHQAQTDHRQRHGEVCRRDDRDTGDVHDRQRAERDRRRRERGPAQPRARPLHLLLRRHRHRRHRVRHARVVQHRIAGHRQRQSRARHRRVRPVQRQPAGRRLLPDRPERGRVRSGRGDERAVRGEGLTVGRPRRLRHLRWHGRLRHRRAFGRRCDGVGLPHRYVLFAHGVGGGPARSPRRGPCPVLAQRHGGRHRFGGGRASRSRVRAGTVVTSGTPVGRQPAAGRVAAGSGAGRCRG